MTGSSILPPPQTELAVWRDPTQQGITFLAHEIRNPLTNIKLAIELLDSPLETDNGKLYFDIIRRNVIRIDELIRELLRYQTEVELHNGEHSLHQILDEVLEMSEDRIRLKNIVVRKEYTAQDLKILMNRQKIKMALSNIIINALEAMNSGKKELKIVTLSTNDKYVVEIRDTGCGISKDNLEHIFKPYFSNKPGGLGLGLSTTCDILRANRVEVNVESEPGTGTHFKLFFRKRII